MASLQEFWNKFLSETKGTRGGPFSPSRNTMRNYKTFQWARKRAPEILETDFTYESLYRERRRNVMSRLKARRDKRSKKIADWLVDYEKSNGAVDPVKAQRQAEPKPPETADTRHSRAKKNQYKTTIYTNSLDQKTRRENRAKQRPSHISPRKNVTQEKKPKSMPQKAKGHVKGFKTIDLHRQPIATITITEQQYEQLSGGRSRLGAATEGIPRKGLGKKTRSIPFTEYRKQRALKNNKLTTHQINRERVANYLRGKKNLADDYKFVSNKVRGFLKNPWTRKTAAFGASIVAFNLITGAINKMFTPDRDKAIPDYYERGYDIIKERMTDFGSPVNLSKTISKTITPRYSTPRNAVYTTVDSVISKNVALSASSSAINHTRY